MFRSKLYWRVFANFALLLILLTAMTFLTLNILSQIERSYGLAAGDVKVLNNLHRLTAILTDTPVAADDYAMTLTEESKTRYESLWKEIDGQIAMIQRDLSDSLMIASLRNIRGYYFQWMENVGDKKMLLAEQREQNKNFNAEFVALSEVESRNRYLENALSQLRELRRRLAGGQTRSIELASNLSRTIGDFIGLVNILIAVFAIALGFVLTRSITNPVRLLKVGTQKMMAGKFEPIELNRTDELGELAADFNQMAAMLGNTYTRLNAYSELVTALNSHVDIQDVEIYSLNLICHHANANVGALYLLNRQTDMLELSAGYALRAGGPQKSFAIGEGIPGQCAKELRTVEISDIPPDLGFSIDTGLVEVAPRYLIAAPVMFQDRLLGVLVLGSMAPFDELKKDIIHNSVPQVGVALTNAKNNDAALKLSREIAVKNEELNKKNSELEKAYRVKSEFLASMSHELRTPLNSIIGFSAVLLGPTGDPLTADQHMALEKVLKNGKHLLQLINDILDFSKLEAGRMTVNVESDNVANIISNTVMTVEMLVKQKGLVMRQEIEPGLPILNTDILKVKQVIVNLLSNAVKFTEHGEIVLTVKSEPQARISFAVRDSGIGIEEKNLPLMFQEFQQIDSSHSRKYKGTGLGLPISRRLARMLGGDLLVESTFGKGSLFTLTIPVVFTVDAVKEIKPVSLPQASVTKDFKTTPIALAVARTIGPDTGTRILCIDDDPDATEILRSYLVPDGYNVTVAFSGDEGIKLARTMKPALITLDIMMPQKDGWQVLRELKRDPATKDIPVIIHSMIDNKPLAMSLGAIDVMPKPVDSRQLLQRVQKVVKSDDQFVLVVDDNKDYTQAMKEMLEVEGFSVRVANSGEEALEELKKAVPAVIFLDVVMPGMDGFQVVRRLQSNDAWRKIPVVILSGKELTDRERDMLQSSITEVINKDDSKEAIASTVKRILTSV
ncbi:MAG: response regulator [Bacteroidota bacterium]